MSTAIKDYFTYKTGEAASFSGLAIIALGFVVGGAVRYAGDDFEKKEAAKWDMIGGGIVAAIMLLFMLYRIFSLAEKIPTISSFFTCCSKTKRQESEHSRLLGIETSEQGASTEQKAIYGSTMGTGTKEEVVSIKDDEEEIADGSKSPSNSSR